MTSFPLVCTTCLKRRPEFQPHRWALLTARCTVVVQTPRWRSAVGTLCTWRHGNPVACLMPRHVVLEILLAKLHLTACLLPSLAAEPCILNPEP